MNMQKILLFSFLLMGAAASAQSTADDYFSPAKPKFISRDRVRASVTAGAGVMTFNKSTYYSSFIAPKIGYQLSNRFRMNIGLMHYSIAGNTFMPLNTGEGLFNPSHKNISGNLLFAEGEYQLNKRVTVTGAVMTDANNFSKNNYKAVSAGLKYETSKHSWIGVQTTISSGESPYYNTHQGAYNFGGTQAPMYDMFGGLGQDFTRNLNNSIR
jgi:hypothetical protein